MSRAMTRAEREQEKELKRLEFLKRLASVREADPLWEMFIWVIESNKEAEMEILGAPNIGDEGAHRQRGRLSMLLDLQEQLEVALEESRRPPES